jgi:lysophospholipid acyltransferase (LPLAT)-like uncharacterized protein
VSEPAWRASASKRVLARAIPLVGYPVVSLLGRSVRWKVEGRDHVERFLKSGLPVVLAFWHGRIFPTVTFFRDRGFVALASQNFDGEWISGIVHRLGIGTARGSSSRNARSALRQLIRDTRDGHSSLFALDGPSGPARHAKAGAVWLAKATGAPLLPFHAEAARHWTFNSWDRTQIPRPFCDVAVEVGAPVFVPRDADAPTIETFRLQLAQTLAELEARALRRLEERR